MTLIRLVYGTSDESAFRDIIIALATVEDIAEARGWGRNRHWVREADGVREVAIEIRASDLAAGEAERQRRIQDPDIRSLLEPLERYWRRLEIWTDAGTDA